MLSVDESSQALRRLFGRLRIARLDDLFRALDTRSRMSVFRRLRALGYFSSITHRGQYYTLESIPTFDPRGLWFHQDVGFSLHGTLKATLVRLVAAAPCGMTHGELQEIVRTRTHDTLLDLVREGVLGRDSWEGQYLYVSGRPVEGPAQAEARRQTGPTESPVISEAVLVEILVEVLLLTRGSLAAPERVASRLRARGVPVQAADVASVYATYGLVAGKKTPRARRSKSLREREH